MVFTILAVASEEALIRLIASERRFILSAPLAAVLRAPSARLLASLALLAFCFVIDAISCRLLETSSSELAWAVALSERDWLLELICPETVVICWDAIATCDKA